MQREHKFLPLAIALVAGLAVSIVFILNHNNSITSVLIVLAVMLGFYIVGLIFRAEKACGARRAFWCRAGRVLRALGRSR